MPKEDRRGHWIPLKLQVVTHGTPNAGGRNWSLVFCKGSKYSLTAALSHHSQHRLTTLLTCRHLLQSNLCVLHQIHVFLLNSSPLLWFSILVNGTSVWQQIRFQETILNTLFSNLHPWELIIMSKFLHSSQIQHLCFHSHLLAHFTPEFNMLPKWCGEGWEREDPHIARHTDLKKAKI